MSAQVLSAIAALIEERAARASKPLPENAGKPYCPGSGSEGAAFEEAFCRRCQYDGSERDEPSDCPILMQAHIVADVHDPEFPNQWVYDKDVRLDAALEISLATDYRPFGDRVCDACRRGDPPTKEQA